MKRYWWVGLVFVIGLILPGIVGEFWVHVAVEILILGLFAVSFNMIFGYMGQLSFGHAAYYGVGAYATGLLMVKASLPLPVGLLASMAAAGICALIIGYFCVRLTGIYFAILTLAFGQMLYYIIFQWYSFTGGDDGLQEVELIEGVNILGSCEGKCRGADGRLVQNVEKEVGKGEVAIRLVHV